MRENLYQAINAMREEKQRCQSELGPLIHALEEDKDSKSEAVESEPRLPCQICGELLPQSGMVEHLQVQHDIQLHALGLSPKSGGFATAMSDPLSVPLAGNAPARFKVLKSTNCFRTSDAPPG